MEIFSNQKYLSKENPSKEIWDLIFINCTKTFIDPSLKIKDRTINLLKYYLDQSFELYNSALNSSDITSPLLQFYSFSNLTKVFVVLRQTKKSTECLSQSHGVKVSLNKNKNFDLKDIIVKIENNGTFTELLQTLDKNINYQDYIGLSFNLRELLNYYIDLYDFLEDKSNIHPIYHFNVIDTQKTPINTPNNERFILQTNFINMDNINQFKQNFTTIDFSKFNFNGCQQIFGQSGIPSRLYYNNNSELPKIIFERNYSNERFIINSIIKDNKTLLLYQIEIQYLISFILSNMVRYYPEEWNLLISKNEIFWELKKTISYMNRSFPNNILNFMTKAYNVVLAPGILERS